MKKALNIFGIYFALQVIEYAIMLLIYTIDSFVRYGHNPQWMIGTFREVTDLCGTRFVFYSIFWVWFAPIAVEKINIKNLTLKLSCINCGLYILISVLMCLFFPDAVEFFLSDFFLFFIISCVLSPTLLFRLPVIDGWLVKSMQKLDTK
jgi:hypothetical protein